MHVINGNRFTSKRPRAETSKVWTPKSAAHGRHDKTRKIALAVARVPSHVQRDKENIPPVSESEQICMRTRNCYSNLRKAQLVAIFDELASSFPWLPVSHVLDKFHDLNPGVPKNTMITILRNRASATSAASKDSPLKVRQAKVSPERLLKYKVGQFSQYEIDLYDEFLLRFEAGKQVSTEWLIATMRAKIGNSTYAHKCTRGWLAGYLNRFEIRFRKASNTHSKTVGERKEILEDFYKFVKILCAPPDGYAGPVSKFGRFPLERRIHGDQVPLEFQGTLNTTLAPKGAHRVQVKQPKLNMDFRVATLMLYFVAEAENPWLRPAICFRMIPFVTSDGLVFHTIPKAHVVRKEFEDLIQEFPMIDIYLQAKGYFDNSVCLEAANDLVDSFPSSDEYLVCMDNLSGQINTEYRDILKKEGNAFILYTPPNCTDVCAVTDAGLGRSIKNLMRKRFKTHFEANIDTWTDGKVTPKERRHLYCEWLRDAMIEFYANNGQKQVLRAFEMCGLAGAYDGSEDDKIVIPGYDTGLLDLAL